MFFAATEIYTGKLWPVTDAASMVAAFAGAVTDDIIEFRADIPAPGANTQIVFKPGITVRNDGTPRVIGSSGQSFGWSFTCNAAGNYQRTSWGSGLTFHCINSLPADNFGSFVFGNGRLEMSSRFTGKNGGSGRQGNQISIYDSVSYPVIADLFGNVADTASSDVLSAIGYRQTNDVVTDHNPGSRVDGWDLVLYSPGTNGSDNWITTHQGLPVRVFGGTFSQVGSGPGVNSGPVTSTMELYGVSMDVSAWAGANNYSLIVVTKAVGCQVIGSPTSSARIAVFGDANKPLERSCWIGGSSTLPIFKGDGHVTGREPVIGYRSTVNAAASCRASSDSVVGFGDLGLPFQAIGSLSAFNSVDINSATVRNKAFDPKTTWLVASNFDVTIQACSASSRSVIHPTGGSTNCHSWKCTGANTQYGIRVDAATGSVATDCAFLAVTAAQFGGSAANAINCTLNGATPSGASIGVAGRGPQLTSGIGLAMYDALEAYLAANSSGVGAGTGYTKYQPISATMASF